MLRVILASCALLLAGCGLEVVELVDAAPRDSGMNEADAAEDAGSDTGVDTGVDTGIEDTGTEDTGSPDTGTPDTGVECVCRFVNCRDNTECEREIGAGSSCNSPVCTGAVDRCTTDRECGVGFMCTTSSVTTDPC